MACPVAKTAATAHRVIDHPGQRPHRIDRPQSPLLIHHHLVIDHQPHGQVRPVEALPVRDRIAHDQRMVHLVVGQQPFGIGLLEVGQARIDHFHADEGVAHGGERFIAADGLVARRDVARDVEGDLDLHADHVHGLAVEARRRRSPAHRQAAARDWARPSACARRPSNPRLDRSRAKRRPGWHRPHRGSAARRAAPSGCRCAALPGGRARRGKYRASC